MILAGKTVIVSGVGSGLGSEMARVALRDGANLAVAARTASSLEATAKELDPSGKRVLAVPTDITDEEQCRALVAATVERFGSVDALIQVAAVDAIFGGLAEVQRDDWLRSVETNVIGSTQLARAAAEKMKGRGGSIVLIGSQSSFLPLIPQIAYASSKGALTTALKFMAKELGPEKIRVNQVVPSWMWGPAVEGYLQGEAKRRGISLDEAKAEIADTLPLREITPDEDVAEAAIFLVSDRARMITGQSLFVNAGEHME